MTGVPEFAYAMIPGDTRLRTVHVIDVHPDGLLAAPYYPSSRNPSCYWPIFKLEWFVVFALADHPAQFNDLDMYQDAQALAADADAANQQPAPQDQNNV